MDSINPTALHRIEVEVTLTESDVIKAYQYLFNRIQLLPSYGRIWIRISLIGGIILALTDLPLPYPFLSWCMAQHVSKAIIFAGMLFAALFIAGIAFSLWYVPRMARQTYRRNVPIKRTSTIVATADGLSFTQIDSYNHAPWDEFTRWGSNDAILIIFRSDQTFNTLPKQHFSPADMGRIEYWLTQAGVPRM